MDAQLLTKYANELGKANKGVTMTAAAVLC